MSTPHVDPNCLEELKEVMEGEFGTLVTTFINDSTTRIKMIKDAVFNSNADEIRKAAHSFKGSCSNIGATILANLCKEMEDIGRSGSTEGCNHLYEMICKEFEAVKCEIKRML